MLVWPHADNAAALGKSFWNLALFSQEHFYNSIQLQIILNLEKNMNKGIWILTSPCPIMAWEKGAGSTK